MRHGADDTAQIPVRQMGRWDWEGYDARSLLTKPHAPSLLIRATDPPHRVTVRASSDNKAQGISQHILRHILEKNIKI